MSPGCAFYGRGQYVLRLGFEDWLKLWVNGEEINTFRHERGFDVVPVPMALKQVDNTVSIKLTNRDNRELRLWALNCVVEQDVK